MIAAAQEAATIHIGQGRCALTTRLCSTSGVGSMTILQAAAIITAAR